MLYLYHFVKTNPSDLIIVFTNSINSTKKLKSLLTLGGIQCVCLHASMQMRQRIKKLDDFRAGKKRVLVSTDVASRGLDVPEVSWVIHFHSPKDVDTMVHRCGRTARNGQEGKSVKYSKDLDQNKVKRIKVPIQKLDEIRALVSEVSKLEKEEFKMKLSKKDRSWEKKMAEAAGIILDDEKQSLRDRRREKDEELKFQKKKLTKVKIYFF